jgi:hypothetical protein
VGLGRGRAGWAEARRGSRSGHGESVGPASADGPEVRQRPDKQEKMFFFSNFNSIFSKTVSNSNFEVEKGIFKSLFKI